MNAVKHKRTDAMIRNIKKLQIEKEYSDTEIAEQIGITPTTYKNIIRSRDSGGNKNIKDSIVNKLADFYDCSTDYILGLSDDKTLNRYGDPVKRPLDFSDRDKLIHELNNYLNSDYKTLCALHFLLCQNPSWRRAEYLKGFHAFTDVLIESSFLELFKERSKEDYKFLVEDSIKFDDEYFNHILQLRKANSLLETADFELSLKYYMEIIYDTLTKSMILEPIAIKAIQPVLWLKKNWDAFPTELNIIADILPQIQHYHFIIKGLTNKDLLGINNDSEAYKDINLSDEIILAFEHYLHSPSENR